METAPAGLSPFASTMPRAVVVNTAPGELEMMDSSWEWGNYDWFFIDDARVAYGTIRELHPDLIVLLMPMCGQHGCRLMSALRLDDETAGIPIMICTAEEEAEATPSFRHESPFHIH